MGRGRGGSPPDQKNLGRRRRPEKKLGVFRCAGAKNRPFLHLPNMLQLLSREGGGGVPPRPKEFRVSFQVSKEFSTLWFLCLIPLMTACQIVLREEHASELGVLLSNKK